MGSVITGVFVGCTSKIFHNGKEHLTGIFKSCTEKNVKVSELGIENDVQADLRFHGGLDKAIYVYPDGHYRYWERILKKPKLEDSQFGENLNISRLDDQTVFIGARYQLGSTIVEVT